MNQLIKVSTNKQGFKVVSARELYDYLEYNSSQWKRWYEKNIENNPFAVQNHDWEVFDIVSNPDGGRPTKDFALTIDFAKKIAMMSRTEKGEQARNYFLECEKVAQAKPAKPRKQKYIEQGKQADWINQRIEAVDTRKHFTGVLKEHGVQQEGYRNCTNAVYIPLFGGTSVVVRERKGIEKTKNIRDNLSKSELAAINLVEQLATEKIEKENVYGNAQCELVCTKASQAVATAITQLRK